MHPKPIRYALGTCLLAATMAAAGHAGPSWFEAYATGARTLALHGPAEFGSVGGQGAQAFVLTLGAHSSAGAVLFTRASGVRPEPGVYRLGEDPEENIQALVVTGPATRPSGAFRLRGAFTAEPAGYQTRTLSAGGR